jgi:adenylate kinase
MIHQIIFVGGIHGVGKTEFCQRVAQHFNIDHVAASTLIRQAGQSIIPGQKQVEAVSKNQDLLIQSLREYRSHSKFFLLDGHFCLIDKNSNIQEIPLATFIQIAPRAVILLTDEPNTIADRIAARDGTVQDVYFTSEFQDHELNHAKFVCGNLNIPIKVHNLSESIDETLDFIKTYLHL